MQGNVGAGDVPNALISNVRIGNWGVSQLSENSVLEQTGAYNSWTIVADPYNASATSLILEKTFVNIVSTDGAFFWYAATDGKVRIGRVGSGAVRTSSTLNTGNTRLRVLCKHGNNQCGNSLGYVKLRFTKQCNSSMSYKVCSAIGELDTTPLPNGMIEWKDPKQGANPNYKRWKYGITIG